MAKKIELPIERDARLLGGLVNHQIAAALEKEAARMRREAKAIEASYGDVAMYAIDRAVIGTLENQATKLERRAARIRKGSK